MTEEIDLSLVEMTNAIIADNTVTGNPNADLLEEEVDAWIVVEEETSIDETTLEVEIIVDIMKIDEEIEMEDLDSVDMEETDLDPAHQQTITEDLQEDLETMISEDHQEETDLDLVAEMDLLTVETGTEMVADILTEEA